VARRSTSTHTGAARGPGSGDWRREDGRTPRATRSRLIQPARGYMPVLFSHARVDRPCHLRRDTTQQSSGRAVEQRVGRYRGRTALPHVCLRPVADWAWSGGLNGALGACGGRWSAPPEGSAGVKNCAITTQHEQKMGGGTHSESL